MAFDKVIYIKLMIICNGIWRGHLYIVSNSICQLWVRWKNILWKFLRTYMLFMQRWKWSWVASKCFSCNLEILKEKYWYLKFIVNFKNWFRRYLSIIQKNFMEKGQKYYPRLFFQHFHIPVWKNYSRKNYLIDFISIFQVVFKTDIYGTFRQTLVYDFGLEPVLSREMQIESAPITDIEKLSKDLVLSEQGRWKVESVDLVPFENK